METTATDPIAIAERSFKAAAKVIAAVRADQLDLPTPCTEWDVRAVINHLIGGHLYFTAEVLGQPTDMTATPPDFTAMGAFEMFQQASTAMIEAWRTPGSFERTIKTLAGPMPGEVLIGIWSNDNLVHAWDIAHATGQDENLDNDMASRFLAMLQHVDLPRGKGAPFQPPKPAPPNAIPEQQLAAFLGRSI